MLHRRGGDFSGGQQQQLAIVRALITRPKLPILDEPTEGVQPSIIKDIERGTMAILLVEQYFDLARDLAAAYLVMQRGEVRTLRPSRADGRDCGPQLTHCVNRDPIKLRAAVMAPPQRWALPRGQTGAGFAAHEHRLPSRRR